MYVVLFLIMVSIGILLGGAGFAPAILGWILLAFAVAYLMKTSYVNDQVSKPPSEWDDFYKLLGLGANATVTDIEKRCVELGEDCRPDKHGDNAWKMYQFEKVQKAYETLTDSAKRRQYDEIYNARQQLSNALTELNRQVAIHSAELLRKRRQMISDKGYGVKDRSAWDLEMDNFFETVVRSKLGKHADQIKLNSRAHIDKQLDSLSRLGNAPKEAPKTGIDFENQCATVLERTGWKVSTTKASGDQGADIIARKEHLTIVLQCKLYSKPVGNSAVQEAHAAKFHYGTKFAGVVTNSSYTKSAIALAASTEVALLHFEDLPNLHGIVKAI